VPDTLTKLDHSIDMVENVVWLPKQSADYNVARTMVEAEAAKMEDAKQT
jgi:hypothetical protein